MNPPHLPDPHIGDLVTYADSGYDLRICKGVVIADSVTDLTGTEWVPVLPDGEAEKNYVRRGDLLGASKTVGSGEVA